MRTRLAELGWNGSDLAREAKVDVGTVGDFLREERMPRIATLSRLEKALGWDPGSIDAAARGRDVRVSRLDPDDAQSVLFASYDANTPLEKVRLLQDLARKWLEEMNQED
ncbi:helix-turn-helix domain-containing protein [Enterococcus hirae]|uniref:helix-turn-helix domain-containing protein n=1 Tax=Enterococcus hirae TaxID=1354 RepID=UPI001370E368